MVPRFTNAEVDLLVDTRKFIKATPLPKETPTEIFIQAQVFSKAEPDNPIRGLIVRARVTRHLTGTGRHRPSASLEYHGIRIRGLDYEMWHDNPDGTVVRGWHEHVWSQAEEDRRVRSPGREPNDLSLRGLFHWGLERWNIEIEQEQLETEG